MFEVACLLNIDIPTRRRQINNIIFPFYIFLCLILFSGSVNSSDISQAGNLKSNISSREAQAILNDMVLSGSNREDLVESFHFYEPALKQNPTFYLYTESIIGLISPNQKEVEQTLLNLEEHARTGNDEALVFLVSVLIQRRDGPEPVELFPSHKVVIPERSNTIREMLEIAEDRNIERLYFMSAIGHIFGNWGLEVDPRKSREILKKSEASGNREAAQVLDYLPIFEELIKHSSGKKVSCSVFYETAEKFPVSSNFYIASLCSDITDVQMEIARINVASKVAGMAMLYAEELSNSGDYSDAIRYLTLAKKANCNKTLKGIEKRFFPCSEEEGENNLPLLLNHLINENSAKFLKVREAEQERWQEYSSERIKEKKRLETAKRKKRANKFWSKLGAGLARAFVKTIEVAAVAAVTYKIADELDIDPSQTYSQPQRRNRQQRSRNSTSSRQINNSYRSGPAQSAAPSCRCACVDGRQVSLCSSAVAVPAICTGVCPPVSKVYQPSSPAAPPPGTTKCSNKSVYNEATRRYETRTICE
jgi:hypothetical protein